jgi:16S rRNA (adenine1518-N6/adenine1519-N6)-dimethyltransferase
MDSTRPNVTSPTELRRLLAEYGIRPAKRLGQSFLIDANIVAKILAAAGVGSGDSVFEVGPGAGALTVALARNAGRVVALEIDGRFVDLLENLLGGAPNVSIVRGDILKADLPALLGDGSWKVLANLPYSVVGPAIARLLQHRRMFPLMLLMVQREVAQRLAAAPGGRDYGVLSVLAQAYMRAEVVGQVGRTCFYPQPRVDSTLVRLTRRDEPAIAVDLEPAFTAVVRAAFRQRRKTLLNALVGAAELALTRERAQHALAAAGIESRRRPESLSPAEFAALARALPGDARC